MGDISVNGQIFSTSDQNIQLFKVFDDVSATSDINPTSTTSWISQQTLSFDANSVLFHNIKTSGYITTGGGFTWPLGGHQWVLRRGSNSNNLGWNNDSSNNILRHTFNRQGDHEHENFSFIEEITSDVSYSYWQCDFSGGGARNNNDDKITWTITNISSSASFNYVSGSGSGSNSEDASFDNIGSYTTNSNINLLNDVSVNGDISAECFHFQGNWSSPSFSGHLIPTEHEVFDIGSAGNKIRHLFLSDNTLWIGDENKLSIKDGNIKFRKLKKEAGVLPYKLAGTNITLDHIQTPQENWEGKQLEEMKLSDWENFINQSGNTVKSALKDASINNAVDIFIDDNDADLKDDIIISDISSSGVSKFTDASFHNNVDVCGNVTVSKLSFSDGTSQTTASSGGGGGGSGGNEFVFRQTTANSTTSVGSNNTPYTITGDYFDASINLTTNTQKVVIQFHLFGEWNHSSNWDQGVVLQQKIGNGSWTLLSNWGDGVRPARNSIFPGDGTSTGDKLSTPEILNFVYVDTPGTTGEISYRPALVSSTEHSRTFFLNRTVGDSNTLHYERGVSTFTLEVKD